MHPEIIEARKTLDAAIKAFKAATNETADMKWLWVGFCATDYLTTKRLYSTTPKPKSHVNNLQAQRPERHYKGFEARCLT